MESVSKPFPSVLACLALFGSAILLLQAGVPQEVFDARREFLFAFPLCPPPELQSAWWSDVSR